MIFSANFYIIKSVFPRFDCTVCLKTWIMASYSVHYFVVVTSQNFPITLVLKVFE